MSTQAPIPTTKNVTQPSMKTTLQNISKTIKIETTTSIFGTTVVTTTMDTTVKQPSNLQVQKVSGPCQACKSGYLSYTLGSDKQCLKYIGPVKIDLASSTCSKTGDKLPLPKNKDENDDLVKFFHSLGTKSIMGVPWYSKKQALKCFTIDLNDAKTEGKFVTSDGQKPTYTNWRSPNPDDWTKKADPGDPTSGYDGEDFVVVGTDNYYGIGLWNDINEKFYIALICQQVC